MYELVSISFLQDRAQSVVAGLGVAWMSLMLAAWNDSLKSWRLRVNCFTNKHSMLSRFRPVREIFGSAPLLIVEWLSDWSEGQASVDVTFGGSSSPGGRFCCAGILQNLRTSFSFGRHTPKRQTDMWVPHHLGLYVTCLSAFSYCLVVREEITSETGF